MLKRIAIVSGIALAAVGSVKAGPYDPKVVPADAKWVAHVDVDAVAKSAFWPMIQQRIDANPEVQNGLAQVEQFAGMTIPQDIHSVTVVGSGFEDGDAVLLINAKANQEQLLSGLQMNPAFSSTSHGSHEIISWEDKGKTNYGSFFSADRIVFGQNKDMVAKLVDVLDGKAEALKADSVMAQPTGPGVLAGVASDSIADLAAKKEKNNPVLKQFQSAWITLGQQGTDVVAKSLFAVGDPKKAEQFKTMAEGAKALGMMAASQENADPGLKLIAPLLAGAQATALGSNVQINWTAPVDQVKQLIEKIEAAKAAKK
jgi:hypothetical protein